MKLETIKQGTFLRKCPEVKFLKASGKVHEVKVTIKRRVK